MRSGNSPNKFAGAIAPQTNVVENMKAMTEAKKAAGDDFDMRAWSKENLGGGMLGTLKNQVEDGDGVGEGVVGKFATMHDKFHGEGGDSTEELEVGTHLTKRKK